METITGFVDHIVFQNSENGYTVMILSTEGEEMTCVGMCKGLTQGENISAEGEYIEHPVYGRQFKIQSYETVTPTDRVGMERYLGSGAIRGVGEALAARIVKKFGDDTFRIIEEEPERLAEVKGISGREQMSGGAETAQATVRVWMRFRAELNASSRLEVLSGPYKGQVLNIIGPPVANATGTRLEILCKTGAEK